MRKLQRAVALVLTLVMVLAVLPLGAAALTVPAGQELIYFADCGADTFPSEIQAMINSSTTVKNKTTPDQAYDNTWGYTNSNATATWANGTTSEEIYNTFRAFPETINGETMSYKFAVEAGTYTVTVGLYDPWSQWAPSRKAVVSVNGSEGQSYSYTSGAGTVVISDVVLSAAGDLTVDIAPDDPNTDDPNRDALVSFIMVTRKVQNEEAPASPDNNTLIWSPVKGSLKITYTCTNPNATHIGGNSDTTSRNYISGKYFSSFSDPAKTGDTWTVQAVLDASAYLTYLFDDAHSASPSTISVALEYVNNKWCFQSNDPDTGNTVLTLEGACTANGPAAPNASNCSTFYVTVYGIDGADTNRMLSSTAHTVSNGGFTISYGNVQKTDGVWTCEATIDATEKINSVLESQKSNHYIMEEDAPKSKTVTLTYNQNSGKWVAENDGVTYSDGKVRAGVAFPLIKQYSITYLPGDHLNGNTVPGDPIDGGLFAAGATVSLPQTTTFTNDGYIFAGWKTTVREGSKDVTYYFPVGTTTMDMFAQDVKLKAYWMKLTLEVASVPYREDLAVADYTFGDTASFSPEEDSVTLLYRADIRGNSTYPYALTCEDAQAVYGSSLSGTIPLSSTTTYVYFTKTYTPEDKISSETVSMAGASDSAAVSIIWNTDPDVPALPGENDSVWSPVGGNNYNIAVTYTCENDQAIHQAGKTVKKNLIYGKFFDFGNPTLVDGTWTVSASLKVGAYLTDLFKETHTSDQTVSLTLEYNSENERWYLPVNNPKDGTTELNLSGVCVSTGPEAPNTQNCSNFFVTVYGAVPQLDGSVDNKSVSSSRWDIAMNHDVEITFSAPAFVDGVWTCNATVDASAYIEEAIGSATDPYRLDDEATKTITLTYNTSTGKWLAGSDGVEYTPSSSKNGVAFKLQRQFTVAYGTERDLAGAFPSGATTDGGAFDAGTTVTLPQDTSYTTENGVFAGWKLNYGSKTDRHSQFYPLGETEMTMPAYNAEVNAYWMDVELEVASEAYDASKAVGDYTFDENASFEEQEAPVTVLYRAQVQGNSEYPYALTCEGAEAAYNSTLSGTIDRLNTSKYVYFTKTYTPGDEVSSETVRMGNASDSAAVSITWKEDHEHTYGAPQWTWAADNSTATAAFTCSAGDDVQTKPATATSVTTAPTCTEAGETVYSATVTFNGTEYTGTKTVTLPATGHKYGAPQWAWAADNSTATATFTCSAGDDAQTVTTTATSSTTAPTCTEAGETVYSATVTFNGTEYTGTKTVTLPATGHSYGAPQWIWHKDHTAYAIFTCAHDKTHQETCKASVTCSVQKATCSRPETTTYTATVLFNGTRYQDKLVVEGYALGHRWNDGEVTTRPTASKPGEKTYTCLRCGAVKYETIPATGETVVDYFWDVSAYDWFADEVTYVVEAGLMEGVGNHLFKPNGEVTRAMTWTVLARMDGEDVDGGTPWYAKARTWAMDDGVSDGTHPNNAVTREQLVTMLYRYAGSPRVYGTLTGYTDCDKVSDWAVDAMIWGTDTGLIQGMGGKLNPQGTATRAQLATMLMRFVEIMK